MTEHILHFGISIDDEAIKKRVEESAYDDVVKKLMNEAMAKTLDRRWGSEYCWDRYVRDAVDRLCEKYKDEIMELVADRLRDSFVRSKAYRETKNRVIDEVLEKVSE